MTWVVGGNCFNGFVCVADIQLTIEYADKSKNRYFNCLQKIHKVRDNLCVAFSGDVRTGLEMIADLTAWLEECIQPGRYFDIDGESAKLIQLLQICKTCLDLVLAWDDAAIK